MVSSVSSFQHSHRGQCGSIHLYSTFGYHLSCICLLFRQQKEKVSPDRNGMHRLIYLQVEWKGYGPKEMEM